MPPRLLGIIMASKKDWADYFEYAREHKKIEEDAVYHCPKCGHSKWVKETNKRGYVIWRCTNCKYGRWPRYTSTY